MEPKRTQAKTDIMQYLSNIAERVRLAEDHLRRSGGGYHETTARVHLRRANIEIGHAFMFVDRCTIMREDFPGYNAERDENLWEKEGTPCVAKEESRG